MNESNPSDEALAELLTLTVRVNMLGSIVYYDDMGKWHRVHGPAVIYSDGTEEWYRHGQRHREGGPACISACGDESWYRHGLRHREDGPAIMWAGVRQWHLNGRELTEEEFNERLRSM